MDYKKTIKEIKTILNIKVKMEQLKLVDGITVLEADSFEPDQAVYIVNEAGNIPLPIGEYNLEDGRILKVTEDGKIAEIVDAPTTASHEELADMPPVGGDTPVEEATPGATPDSGVSNNEFNPEDYVKKTDFETAIQEIKDYIGLAREKMNETVLAKDAEIEILKNELDSKPAATKIVHNQESSEKVKTSNVGNTKLQKILNLIEK
jgi:hypothetical protein